MANLKIQTSLSAAILFLLVGSKIEAREQYKNISAWSYILEVWSVGNMVSYTGDLQKQEYSLTRASDQSRIFSNTGQSTLGKIGLGYWLLSKTGQVEQPPYYLGVRFT